MKIFCTIISIVALVYAILAFIEGDIGYGFGLLGGACAWLLLSMKETDEDKENGISESL